MKSSAEEHERKGHENTGCHDQSIVLSVTAHGNAEALADGLCQVADADNDGVEPT
jgi:hypothetical protein